MKSFWQAAVGGHSAGVVLKPEYCPSLCISQQTAQCTAAGKESLKYECKKFSVYAAMTPHVHRPNINRVP